jgi:zinc protease
MGRNKVRVAAVIASFVACKTPEPNRAVKIAIKAESFSGNNGVRVFTIPDDASTYIGFHARYAVGSVQDPPGKAGLAHLVEHLMFARPARIGGREGSLGTLIDEISIANNAVTTADYTHYWAVVARDQLGAMFEIESARVLGGCQAISAEVFELEREVVANEQREKMSGDSGQIYPALLRTIYGAHPYARDPGGTPDDLAALTLDDVCAFLQQHYNARNLAFYVTGAASPDQVRQTAIPWLSKLPVVAAGAPVTVPAIHPANKVVKLDLDVELPYVYAAWRMPTEHTAYSLVEEVSDALESRLSWFVYTYGIGRSVDVFTLGGDKAPVIVAEVQLASPEKESAALDALRDAASHVDRALPDDEQDVYSRDMIDARTWRSTQILTAFERLGTRGFISADAIDRSGGKAFLISELEHLPAITLGNLRDMAKAMLDPDRAIFVAVTPSGNAASHGGSSRNVAHESNRWRLPADPREAQHPLRLAPTTSQSPTIEDYRLSNGMRVILAQSGSVPLVRASLVFAVGAVHGPAKNPAVASLAGEWQGGEVSDDFTIYDSTAMSSRLDYLIKGLAYGKRGIEFDQQLLETYREIAAAKLKVPSVRARAQFSDAVYRHAFGSNHPYARVRDLGPEDLRATNRSDLRAFGDRYYGARNATLILVGKFDAKIARAHIRENFAHWEKRTAARRTADAADPTIGMVAVRDGTTTQLQIVLVHPGSNGVSIAASAKRLVAESMLSARLRTMREELGITYGAAASYSPHLGPGLWMIQTEVDPKRGAEGLGALTDAIDSLRKERDPQFDADFVLARRTAARDLQFELSDSSLVLSRLRYAAGYGLPLDHHEVLLEAIANVTPDQVHAVFASELDPSRRVVGIYGPDAAVTATLAGTRR